VLELLARSEDRSPSAFWAHYAAAWAALARGEQDIAEQMIDGLSAATPERGFTVQMHEADLRHNLARNRGDISVMTEHVQRLIDAAAYCDPWMHAFALIMQGGYRTLTGELDIAAVEVEEGLAAARQLGSSWLVAYALVLLATVVALADPERGRALLLEGVSYQRSFDVRYLDDATLTITAFTAAIVHEEEIALRAAAQILDRRTTADIGLFGPLLDAVAASIVGTAPENAAVVHGIVDTIAPDRHHSALRPWTNAAIDTALDPARATQLHAQGIRIRTNDIAGYVSDLIARQLAERSESNRERTRTTHRPTP
jgi:hypothetical protein